MGIPALQQGIPALQQGIPALQQGALQQAASESLFRGGKRRRNPYSEARAVTDL